MDEEKIKKEAKQIMDNFLDALQQIEVEEEFILKREINFREDKDLSNQLNLENTQEFKQNFLYNAPKANADAIIANKGSWVK